MDADFLSKLNEEQQKAVINIDGPLLVIAGPGTGKTQLLSSRVAYILKSSDALPENILCLTFTESAAFNMRERLESIIGQEANKVTISTYHSFGSDIISSYPEYFQTISVNKSQDQRLERPIDDLSAIQIVSKILEDLSYDNPLLSARYYVKSVVGTIGELKQALITPDKLRSIATSNLKELAAWQPLIESIITNKGGISRKKAECFAQYNKLHSQLTDLKSGSLTSQAKIELSIALDESRSTSKNTPLTKWKNKWLIKNDQDIFEFTKKLDHEKMIAFADIYQAYDRQLAQNGLYDFNDMILKTIATIQDKDELRYNLQEKYQYILLDEFQDTNPSQFALVHMIANHPVHEGRPNIMAVGDDDQAIYAFQGADIGNMKTFINSYRDVAIVNLTKNYRSHAQIIEVAHNVSAQIEDRVHHSLDGLDKLLTSASKSLPKEATIGRHIFISETEEYTWTANKIKQLITDGAKPQEIAVLSPRHSLLEKLVPYIASNETALTYEKRENILDTPLIISLHTMCRLVIALRDNDLVLSNELFPRVLSNEYWQIPVQDIWTVNWSLARKEENRTWAEIALDSECLRKPVLFFLKLALVAPETPLEIMLDYLTGNVGIDVGKDEEFTSPLKSFYFTNDRSEFKPLIFYEGISYLSIIRAKLRDYQLSTDDRLMLDNFIDFIDMYAQAEQPLINTHPVSQSQESVQLMTVYKAKGLEFEHVFLLSVHDDIWGKSSRGQSNKISLPENLKSVRYRGSSEDELKRLLFVAITRAKHGLYITTHENKDTGKRNKTLAYLNEVDGIVGILPEEKSKALQTPATPMQVLQNNEQSWSNRHLVLDAPLKLLLQDRLNTYRLSPTHLNGFIDLIHAGPEAFVLGTLLRFPESPSLSGEYGTAIHNTLEWYQIKTNEGEGQPEISDALRFLRKELGQRFIPAKALPDVTKRAEKALSLYLSHRQDMFKIPAKAEVNFYNENVVIGDARISGKIDRLEIDEASKSIHIVDYKTGAGFDTWKSKSDIKAHKYEQQLYMYKILIENSYTYRGYRVESARLEFVEPRADGSVFNPLHINFDKSVEHDIKLLINAVWQNIQNLNFPDTSSYPVSVQGIYSFEADLIQQ